MRVRLLTSNAEGIAQLNANLVDFLFEISAKSTSFLVHSDILINCYWHLYLFFDSGPVTMVGHQSSQVPNSCSFFLEALPLGSQVLFLSITSMFYRLAAFQAFCVCRIVIESRSRISIPHPHIFYGLLRNLFQLSTPHLVLLPQ